MRAIMDGFQLAWTLGIRRIRVQSESMAVIYIFVKDSTFVHLYLSFYAVQGAMQPPMGKSIFLIFTVELIMLRNFLTNLGHLIYSFHIFYSSDRCLSH
ncbi:hypothetical protein LINGRAHAP2_LOCUS8103 [Linum grandiflorum]